MPFDLLIGWVVLWSAVPVLALDRLPLPVTIAIVVGFDLLYMPMLESVLHLGPNWLVGESFAVTIGLVPALLLARWTADDRRLGLRVAQQGVLFGILLFFVIPAAVVGARGLDSALLLREWADSGTLLPGLRIHSVIALGLLPIPMALGLSAVLEFARRGGGTPFPWDPPKRLVTSGP